MKVVLITGLSGSGKSVALKALEDVGFFCIDNLPPEFLGDVVLSLEEDGRQATAVAIDARSTRFLSALPDLISRLQTVGHDVKVIYLHTDTRTLVTRYSESRRRHPASDQLGNNATVAECVEFERDALAGIKDLGNVIDTSDLLPNVLRRWIEQAVMAQPARLTLIIESFAFKGGVPRDADLMFDARCLGNPYYDRVLRPQSGLDADVVKYFEQQPAAAQLIDDIEAFVRTWLPAYLNEQRNYLTIAIGCTGGQHRSVYVADQLARRFQAKRPDVAQTIVVRHRSVTSTSA
ncbi:MAG: RNase adapter RapZ [Burkholderiaceae bacterium]|jgi:UPF0042 nucleotide-binding protein